MVFAKEFDSVNHRLRITTFICYGIVPYDINWAESFLSRRSLQVSINDSLSHVADAIRGIPQGSPLVVIYINDLVDNLTIDHLLYADDAKVGAPGKRAFVFHIPLVVNFKWSECRGLIPNSAKSKHILFGDTFNPVTYTLTSRTSPLLKISELS